MSPKQDHLNPQSIYPAVAGKPGPKKCQSILFVSHGNVGPRHKLQSSMLADLLNLQEKRITFGKDVHQVACRIQGKQARPLLFHREDDVSQ